MRPAVTVAHATAEYPVYVAPGILAELPSLIARHLPGRRIAVISDRTVATLYRAEAGSAAGDPTGLLEFPAGEAAKTRETWAALTDDLLERGFGRNAGVVALGGGVTGDLAGFVAATYMRGLPLLQVPTTLLAMLDASVGGKVGVDTALGKNLVGAFHPPVAVVADPLVLRTLPDRAFRAGIAEAVKHGLVADAEYLSWIEANAAAITAREMEPLVLLIIGSVAIKAGIVSGDEREQGRRAVLNAGHTVAHALEGATGYSIPHGEAVGLGLVAECALGEALGITAPGTGARVRSLLERLGLPVTVGGIETDRALAAMALDKKNRGAGPEFALVESVGRAHAREGSWTTPADAEAIRAALRSVQ